MTKHRRTNDARSDIRGCADASDLTLQASWRTLLEPFRPAFRRSYTFGLFRLLATRLVRQAERRTMFGMLAATGRPPWPLARWPRDALRQV
jgi:hypothetical protein